MEMTTVVVCYVWTSAHPLLGTGVGLESFWETVGHPVASKKLRPRGRDAAQVLRPRADGSVEWLLTDPQHRLRRGLVRHQATV
jgi:hypothetical protein